MFISDTNAFYVYVVVIYARRKFWKYNTNATRPYINFKVIYGCGLKLFRYFYCLLHDRSFKTNFYDRALNLSFVY